MSNERVPIGFDFQRILETISSQIYDTPMAFLRENVQNAVDALRMESARDKGFAGAGKVEITVEEKMITVRDNGIGMSREELEKFFWSMGASGKNTPLAKAAGCVGQFGIGGFANFGVCSTLVVTSMKTGHVGYSSRLTKTDISGPGIPSVEYEQSNEAAPHGTIVRAYLDNSADPAALKEYLKGFVRYVPEIVVFNDVTLSQEDLVATTSELTPHSEQISTLQHFGAVTIIFLTDKRGMVYARVTGSDGLRGSFRFEEGPFEVFKRGFKLCNTPISSQLGMRGRLEGDMFRPTAGRDSLSAESTQLIALLTRHIEQLGANVILDSEELIAANNRVLKYVVAHGLIARAGKLRVSLADGKDVSLESLQHTSGDAHVYFGRGGNKEILEILQKSGHQIVVLSGDGNRREVERRFLEQLCGAKTYEGLVDIRETYSDLSLFEQSFLAEIEATIKYRYDVYDFTLTPAAITGGIPAFSVTKGKRLTIYIDVRHAEVVKLHPLGVSPFLYSMATEFCKEYLGNILKERSPKFFGSGAMNIDDVVKKRAELWKLAADDILVDTRGAAPAERTRAADRVFTSGVGVTQVVSVSDIQSVDVSDEASPSAPASSMTEGKAHRILRIVDRSGKLGIDGYYIRLMDAPSRAYGDDIQSMDQRGLLWFGNKLTYVFSDGVKTAFHYDLRLSEMIRSDNGEHGGFVSLARPIQELNGGMFLPIELAFERYLVPTEGNEIAVKVNYDWFDLDSGRALLDSKQGG